MTELFAVAFDWQRGDPEQRTAKLTRILDNFCEHPSWVTAPMTPDEMRVLGASILVNPSNRIMEVWQGGVFTGLLLLTHIVPKVDAVAHFVFFDEKLLGRRALILNWLGQCFEEFDLQRITLEVPEFVGTLAHYARRKLGFRYEGETRPLNADLPQNWDGLATYIATQGSRKERAHFKDGEWYDILRLRLLRSEFVAGKVGRGE